MKQTSCKLCGATFVCDNGMWSTTCDCARTRAQELAVAQRQWDESRPSSKAMTKEEFDGLSESGKEDFEPSPPTGIVDRDFTDQGGTTLLADQTDTLEDGIDFSTRCERCQCRTPRERWRTASGHLICRYCAGLAQRPIRLSTQHKGQP